MPEYLLSNNGLELVAAELAEWLTSEGVKTHHIDPGGPWQRQNAYGESFNAILRQERLNRELFLFYGVLEARVKTESWRPRYNERQPHSSLGYLTPARFRDGLRIPLLEQDVPRLTGGAARSRGEDRTKRKTDLYLQMEQSQGVDQALHV